MSSSVKFLIVDDIEENLVALSALLERDGLELFRAHSGTEALELLLAHDFALALLDVQMPGMDGFELAELMRGAERSKHVPIIFVTASPREQSRLFRGYESGAVDFLFKPVEPVILRHKANTFFQLYRQKQQLTQEIEMRERLVVELRETLRLNEMFTAVLGHDLRTPLGAMIAGASVLVHRSPDDMVPKRILSSGSRMSQMIDQLLDLARARLGGGIPVASADVDLATLLPAIVAEHRAMSPEKHIALETKGDLRGRWDEGRLAQVFSNLIGNAVKHGAPGGGVAVIADGRNPVEVIVEVSNQGVIDAERMASLFDPFRGGKPGAQGLGLGLYIVDQIARAHCGHVEARSSEPQGTCFRVRLPRTGAG